MTGFRERALTRVEQIKEALCAEEALRVYSDNLCSLIKNGTAKRDLCRFPEICARSEKALRGRLQELGVKVEPGETDLSNPESFSTLGLIHQGVEMAEAAVSSYRRLLKDAPSEEKRLYRQLLREKEREWKLLIREKRFHEPPCALIPVADIARSIPLSFC